MKKFLFSPWKLCLPGLLTVLLAAPVVRAQQSAGAAAHRTASARPAATPAITVSGGNDAENEPSPPLDAEPGTPETTETEILATDGATFNSKDRIAVFTGDVRVTDPRFQLSCDKLTVFLNKSATTDAGTTPIPTPAPTPPPVAKGSAPVPAPTPANTGGIDHAIAEGHVIIVQERAATAGGEAKRSVGKSDWADFDNKTGDMVLKGTPTVEQNDNTHTATSPDTVMTLRKDNSLKTVGPSRTIIHQHKGSDLPGAANGAPGAAKPGQTPPARSGQPGATPAGRRPHAGPPTQG
jgi:lipopolysaccharide export system protein LptA